MRLQLSRPDNDLISAARYNEIFTMHGTTMMFLFAVPVMQGDAGLPDPLMIGTRNTAFPRLNAFCYWMYLLGGLLLWVRVRAQHRTRHRLVRLHAAVGAAIRRRASASTSGRR